MKYGPARPRPEEPNHPFVGSLVYQGIQIDLEHHKGDYRSGTSPEGVEWRTKMPAAYGEIRDTEGADGDAVDVYVGPDAYAPYAYVIQTKFPGRKAFDEVKVMLGFPSQREACATFRRAYDKPGFFLGCTRWPIGAFREALKRPHLLRGRLTRPLTKGARLVLPARQTPSGDTMRTTRLILRKARQAPPVPPQQDQEQGGRVDPHLVTYRHPRTGKERKGTVHAVGVHGATIQDHETGEDHEVEHGHYLRPDEAHPSHADRNPPGKMRKAVLRWYPPGDPRRPPEGYLRKAMDAAAAAPMVPEDLEGDPEDMEQGGYAGGPAEQQQRNQMRALK